MPLRALLAVSIFIAPIAVGATDDGEPEKVEDPHIALVTEIREGFRAGTPVQEIWTPEKTADLKEEGAKPDSLEAFKKVRHGMPFIRAVQKQLASPEERYRAFLALDIKDDGSLYREWEKPVIPAKDRVRLEAEKKKLEAKYEKEKLNPDERGRVDSRMAQIARLLGTGPSTENLPEGVSVIQAGMGPNMTPGQAMNAYMSSGGNAHSYKSLKTGAVKAPTAVQPTPKFEPWEPPGTIERVWNNLKGIDIFKMPEGKDYFEGGQAQILSAVHAEAEEIIKDPNFKHATLDHIYQGAPDRYKKALVEWQILSQSRYGGEKALIEKYGLTGKVTVSEVADADHFHAASTISAVPGIGTAAGVLGTVVYDGGQVGRDLWRGNWKSALYNTKQVWTDIKGVAFGITLLAPGG